MVVPALPATMTGKQNEGGRSSCDSPRATGLSCCSPCHWLPSWQPFGGLAPGPPPLLHVTMGLALCSPWTERTQTRVHQPQHRVGGLTQAMWLDSCGTQKGVTASSEEGLLEQALGGK